MTDKRELHSVLIISASEDMRRALRAILCKNSFEDISNARNAEEARRLLLHRCYDLVMIDSALPCVIGHELALDIAEKGSAEVILLSDIDSYDQTRYRVEAAGIITLQKPMETDIISTAINIAMASHNRILAIEEENKRLRFKNEELRLCNRAKWVLHENMGMDEPSAHRYIEKKAMDNRITRYAVAKEILKEYE